MAWRARRAKRARMESPRLGMLRAGTVVRSRRRIIRSAARLASKVPAINRAIRKMEIKASALRRRAGNKVSRANKEMPKRKMVRRAIKSNNWPAIILKASKMVHRNNKGSARANAVNKAKTINKHKTGSAVKTASKDRVDNAVISRHETASRAINNRKAIRTANKIKAAKMADARARGID